MRFGNSHPQGSLPPQFLNILVFTLFFFLKSIQGEIVLSTTGVVPCTDSNGSTATVSDLKIVFLPNGKELSATLSGHVTQRIKGGKVYFKISVLGSEMYSGDSEICAVRNGKSTCPIEPGQFVIPFNKPLDSALGSIQSQLIKIPGLGIQAALELVNDKGQKVGCAKVKLTGDTSAKQPFITGLGISMVATTAFIAAAGTFIGGTMGAATTATGVSQVRPGPTPSLECVVSVIQGISVSGLLNLDRPEFFQQFTENFGWAMGMVKIDIIKVIASYIRQEDLPNSAAGELTRRGFMPDANAKNYSELSGIAKYSSKLGIDVNNYFITVAFIILCVMAGFTAACLLLRLILELLSIHKPNLFTNIRNHFALYYVGNLLRVFLLCYFVLATAALFQLTLKDYWLVTFFAVVVLLLFCIGLMGFVSFRVTKAGPTRLYSNQNLQTKYGALYSDYRSPTYTFFLPVLLSAIIRAIAVGALSDYVYAQMSILVITEIIFFVALFYYRPYAEKLCNNLLVFIGVMRIMNTVLLFAFIETAKVNELARNVIGFVLVAIQSLMILAIITMTLYSLGSTIYKLTRNTDEKAPLPDRNSFDAISNNSEHSLVRQSLKEELRPMDVIRTDNKISEKDHTTIGVTPEPIQPPTPDADSYFPSQPISPSEATK